MWANLAAQVGPGDVLIHVGDVVPYGNAKTQRGVVDQLPGDRRILIEGNHDKKRVRAYASSNPAWKGKGWHLVIREDAQPWTMKFLVDEVLVNVVFSHYPPKVEELPKSSLVIHGHIHDIGPRERWVGKTKIINGCVEQNGYAPFELYEEVRVYLEERKERSGATT